MKKIILFFFIVCLFSFKTNKSYCQEFLALNNGWDYASNFEDFLNYDLVRTDEDGNVVWTLSFESKVDGFDIVQPEYIVMNFTKVVNGKIIDNPGDYDYWLVRKEKQVDFTIFPNPNTGQFNIYCSNLDENSFYEIYDSSLRIIERKQIFDNFTLVNLNELKKGFYFITFIQENSNKKIEKICIL